MFCKFTISSIDGQTIFQFNLDGFATGDNLTAQVRVQSNTYDFSRLAPCGFCTSANKMNDNIFIRARIVNIESVLEKLGARRAGGKVTKLGKDPLAIKIFP